MQLKNNFLTLVSTLEKHFVTPFCLSIFVVLVSVSILGLNPIFSINNFFVLCAGLVFGILGFTFWLGKLPHGSMARRLIEEFSLPLSFASLLLVATLSFDFTKNIPNHSNITNALVFVLMISGFVSLYANTKGNKASIVQAKEVPSQVEQKPLSVGVLPILLFLIFSSVVLKSYLAFTANFDLDEGLQVYDSYKALHGFPVAEFYSRTPVFHILMGNIINLFFNGNFSIFNARIIIVFLNTLSGILIYFISKNLFRNSYVALISVVLFYFTPFFVYWYGYIVNTQNFILPIILLLILIVLRQKNPLAFFAGGILIGFSYFIRKSVLLFAPAISAYLLLEFLRPQSKHFSVKWLTIQNFLAFSSGIFTGLLIIFLILAAKSNSLWAWSYLNPIRSAFPQVAPDFNIPFFKVKLSIVYHVLLLNLPLVIFALFSIFSIFKKHFLPYVFLILSILLFFSNNFAFQQHGFQLLPINNSAAFISLAILFLYLVSHGNKQTLSVLEIRSMIINKKILLPALAFASYLAIYLYKDDIFVSYFADFFYLILFLSSPALYFVTKNMRKGVLYVFILISIAYTTGTYWKQPVEERNLSVRDISHMKNVVLSNTSEQDKILSLQLTLNTQANRKNILDYNRELSFLAQNRSDLDFGHAPYDLEYAKNIEAQIASGDIKLIVVDYRLGKLLKKNPKIENLIKERYVLIETYYAEGSLLDASPKGRYEIYELAV